MAVDAVDQLYELREAGQALAVSIALGILWVAWPYLLLAAAGFATAIARRICSWPVDVIIGLIAALGRLSLGARPFTQTFQSPTIGWSLGPMIAASKVAP